MSNKPSRDRVEEIRTRLLAAVEANNNLLDMIKEYEEMPDFIFSAKDILSGLSESLSIAGPLMKLTPYGWLSWVFTLGGAFLKGVSKLRKRDKDE